MKEERRRKLNLEYKKILNNQFNEGFITKKKYRKEMKFCNNFQNKSTKG